MRVALLLLLAYGLDRWIGDPSWLPHPVIAMGKMISWLERCLLTIGRSVSFSRWGVRLLGAILPLVIVGGVYTLTWWLVMWCTREWNNSIAFLLEVGLIATTIATKGLAEAAQAVQRALQQGEIKEARARLKLIVGRDTDHLEEEEVVRATVETVAENIVDAVSSPLFYAFVGGAPLALAYRAVNTLDSMVGYKNEKYRDFGWASARLDDIANWLPARLMVGSFLLAMWLLRLDARGCWKIMWRDARKHPSPNSGIPEAGMAGGLGIRLGGANLYQGVRSHRAYLGEEKARKRAHHIKQAVAVLFVSTQMYTLFLALIGILLWRV
ncbi:adenosylcobinamide-phosphate synthase CbiB [Mechercharimyces sp. CAU 1602]|uniref:adenosylcobinamide-phosphate synthase CbiB n=1 Tax=Mechercharimyces sp. CAU 1602 TaxID=2973933 RepID=UPI0021627856|nr:adenosylcobinamide-phosphate synthase CbiB [Mechercharimyces sp. CAU 1602]MCS1351851.1 adenosylcobinamide-phosphate synthase CbiB [Mechercharimyces sp. CAU 1602]